MITIRQERPEDVNLLLQVGLRQCREMGVDAVFMVGEPEFYSKFGFGPASNLGICCEFDVPETYWLVKELRPESLSGISSLTRYRLEFQAL
jgi:putative acetyltransferase